MVGEWSHACSVSLGRMQRPLSLLAMWHVRPQYVIPSRWESLRVVFYNFWP